MVKRLLWLSSFLFMSFTGHAMWSPIVKNLMTYAYFTSMVWYPWQKVNSTVIAELNEKNRIQTLLDNGHMRHVDLKTKNIIREITQNPNVQVVCDKNAKNSLGIRINKNIFNNNETVYISDLNNDLMRTLKRENKPYSLHDFEKLIPFLTNDSDTLQAVHHNSLTFLEGKFCLKSVHEQALATHNIEKYRLIAYALIPLALPGASTLLDLAHHPSWPSYLSPLKKHSLVCLGGIALFSQSTRLAMKAIDTLADTIIARDVEKQLLASDRQTLLGGAIWYQKKAIIGGTSNAQEQTHRIMTTLQKRGLLEDKTPVQ